MLLSLAIIFTVGLLFGYVFEKLKLPDLLGMLLAGILIGPYVLNLLDPSILLISSDLRQIALIIILIRAGLNLDIEDLKKVGRPALLMCFVPACFEIVGMILLAPKFLGVTILEAAILGSVIAAVSPAVVVPRMLKLMDEGYGTKQSIPSLIMAGASVDDVFVIVVFSAFVNMEKGGLVSFSNFLTIPVSIGLGLLVGGIIGYITVWFFKKNHIKDTIKIIIVLSISFLLVSLEKSLSGIIGFSGLLSVMALGNSIQQKHPELSIRLSSKFSKLWTAASILLFVLVGASVNIVYAEKTGLVAVALILLVLVFRVAGVFVCLIKTKLNKKERLFSAMAYIPKATVQAAIGGIPLAMGLACGDIVLSVAVISILVSAPIGAILIDSTYKRLLEKA